MIGKSISRDLSLYSRLEMVYTDIEAAACSLVTEHDHKVVGGGAVHD